MNCMQCDRVFVDQNSLQQHLRDSPAHGPSFLCRQCNRTFGSEEALQQHQRDSSIHNVTFFCEPCDRAFKNEDALQQHQRDSLAHAVTFLCEPCNRTFNDEDALQQHQRDSPAHAARFLCELCDRTFSSEEALRTHEQNSSAHATSLSCKPCNRTFRSEDALRQHQRDSPVHPRLRTSIFSASSISSGDENRTEDDIDRWSMFPNLHERVLRELENENLNFDFYGDDDFERCIQEHETNIMGRFECRNSACHKNGWSSKKIPTIIRLYTGDHYNVQVYHQHCKKCDYLSRPILDETAYVERVVYRLQKWRGVEMAMPPYSGKKSNGPHLQDQCEGCKDGRCEAQISSRLQYRRRGASISYIDFSGSSN